MELELHQLDFRYESLRILNPKQERKLLASIGEAGQLVPISVLAGDDQDEVKSYVILDGFARVRVLRRLARDTVQAVVWNVTELEALLMARPLRSSQRETTLEQAWLLEELVRRFQLDHEDLARRFDRSPSWVSRRLALVRELPESVHEEIRKGRIVSYAAEKYLVPMARANRSECERMARVIAKEDFSTREVGELYAGWRDGSQTTRERLIENPRLFLRVRRSAEKTAPSPEELELRDALLKEAGLIGAAIRRSKQRFRQCVEDELTPLDLEDLSQSFRVIRSEISRFINIVENQKAKFHVRPKYKDDNTQAPQARPVKSEDCPNAVGFA